MKFTFVTLFPDLMRSYFSDSIISRAIAKGFIEISFVNPRSFSKNKYSKVDDYQVGGGAGLLLEPQSIGDCLEFLLQKEPKSHIVFLTPCAKQFNHKDSRRLALKENIIFVCGRYEGFDERLIELYASEVFSIGDFVMTGGELAALCLCDSISRNLKGVLGNMDSLRGESFEDSLLEAPNFVKPYEFKGLFVPSVYSKGNHAIICDFKKQVAEAKTKFHRPDLYLTKRLNK
ncbi:tRNA (guanosine(37)-N1)-methyltransferase TrmD [Helicobacter burdigaliensis]|uniref:tRNA (guanosine(37)-N1)-methyltransferase TrmD n=1 Tax=Helicobacter burdigaliensis TaxID=2315334 RepID=UPI000EF74A83|nr:tRNA (guanosine(37)-N1)-methyltransferase TrmD [Helicobacter burdigaliensis]